MLDHAHEAMELAKGRSREDLDNDRQFNLSLTRLLEIVGEAANHVPSDIRVKYPQVPWRDITDFRNRLIHGYFAVDFDILWQIVREDLPRVIDALEHEGL